MPIQKTILVIIQMEHSLLQETFGKGTHPLGIYHLLNLPTLPNRYNILQKDCLWNKIGPRF